MVLSCWGIAENTVLGGPPPTDRRITEESLGFGEGEFQNGTGNGSPPSAPAAKSAPVGTPSSPAPDDLMVSASPLASKTLDPNTQDTARKTDLLRMRRDELFEKVFKKAPLPRLRELSVRLQVDGKEFEQVKLLWNDQFTEYQFQSSRLKTYLDTMQRRDKLDVSFGKDGYFYSQQLRQRQFELAFDEGDFRLQLSTPAALKPRRLHDLGSAGAEWFSGKEVRPAFVSAYLNTNWYQNWMYNERFFQDDVSRRDWERYNGVPEPVREPFQGDWNGAVRTMDWVLLGSGVVRESERGELGWNMVTRNETRLLRDFVPWNTRLSLLDVSANHGTGDFIVPNVGGVDLVVGNGIIPNHPENRTGVDFFLQRTADVTVRVNGDAIKTLPLSSGPHRIEGITGRPGENQVEVQVVYLDGSSETIPYRFFQAAPQVLPEGERLAAFTAGSRRLGENEYGITATDLVATGSYEQGISPFVTAAIGMGAQKDLQVGTANLLLVEDSLSTWRIVGSVSHDSLGEIGQKWGLQYFEQFRPFLLSANATFVQASFRNNFFGPKATTPYRYQLGLNVGGPIWKGSINTNVNIQFNRPTEGVKSPIDYSFGTNFSIGGWKGLSLSTTGNCVISGGEFTPSISLTMSYFFNAGRHSFYAMNQTMNQKKYKAPSIVRNTLYDTMQVGLNTVIRSFDSASIESGYYENEWRNLSNSGWSWSESMGMVGGKAVSLSANYATKQYGLAASTQRTTNLADLSANYSLSDQSQIGLMSRNHYLSARMSSALMFADGLFAIGRPVQDGFVLVSGQHEMASTQFRINPSDHYNSEYSNGGRFLAAPYGLLMAYRTEQFQVKASDPPAGTFLDGEQYFARNTYKQGFVLRLGKPPRVFVRFRLVDETGQAMAYSTFRVFNVSDSTAPVHQSFSSRDGIVQISDLEPGKKYTLRFGEDAFIKPLTLTIPKGSPSIINLGDMKVEHESLYALTRLSQNAPDPAKKTQDVASSPDPFEKTELPSKIAVDPSLAPAIPPSVVPDGSRPKSTN